MQKIARVRNILPILQIGISLPFYSDIRHDGDIIVFALR